MTNHTSNSRSTPAGTRRLKRSPQPIHVCRAAVVEQRRRVDEDPGLSLPAAPLVLATDLNVDCKAPAGMHGNPL